MSTATFVPLDHVADVLERVLAASPADETELVWLQRRRGWADAGDGGVRDWPLTSILVRVVEGRRLGWYRTEVLDANELESGVRHALALAKVQPRVKRQPVFLQNDAAKQPRLADEASLHDGAIQGLAIEEARGRLRPFCSGEERAVMRWSTSRLAIFNSHGLRRTAASTEASLAFATSAQPGAGWAASSARSLDALDLRGIGARARGVAAAECRAASDLPGGATPALLAPEATVELLNVLNGHALSGRAYLDGTSFLTRHRNVQVFDRRFNLRDDGTSPLGLAFPFDLEGAAKQPLDLIVEGKPSTPALNRHQGQEAGLRPTGQAVGGEDSMFGNLFLQSGGSADEDLLGVADGGIRIGWLEPPECLDPGHLQIRVTARGVRRIRDGQLGEALPDLVWEDSLLRVLAQLGAIGQAPVVRATPTTPLGAISAPAVVLRQIDGLRPVAA